jgi:DNA-binding transcriptional LysR family regulator
MNLQQIRYFLALAKELHFWRTAEKMYITQSALSRHISSLENELGLQLFLRNKRNVKLTCAGTFLRDEWQRLLNEIDNVHRHAKQIAAGEIGELKIGHPGSITYSVLPELLTALSTKHPDLQIQLVELATMDMEKALINYEVDVCFNRQPPDNSGLKSNKILTENLALVVAENHWLSENNLITLSQLREEKFILPSMTSENEYAESLRAIFQEYNYFPNTHIVSEFGVTILSLVSRGLGVSILPISYSAHSPKGVRFIKLSHHTNLFVIWRKSDEISLLQNFLKVVEQCFRATN